VSQPAELNPEKLRTTDTKYGTDYWGTLDGGRGYTDSVMWSDMGHIIAETYLYGVTDRSLELSYCDVGCAFGYLVRHMRKRGVDSYGLDGAWHCVERAPEDVAFYIRHHDLTSPEPSVLGTERFDVITCFETLEHIGDHAANRAVQTILELLKPGGHALLTICLEGHPGWDTDPTHVNIRPREYWEKRLDAAGFLLEDHIANHLRSEYWLFSAHEGVFTVQRPV
jgi:SAM-dependent methyltransferase